MICTVEKFIEYQSVPIRPFWYCPDCGERFSPELTRQLFLLSIEYLSDPLINLNFGNL